MTQRDSPYIPPRLTLRVGVTGHRPNKLEGVDTARLQARAATVLESLASLVHRLQSDNDTKGDDAPFAQGTPALRLATGIAEGADRIVAEAAIEAGYALNLFLPFPHDRYAQDFDGDALTEYQRFLVHSTVSSCTELDLEGPDHDPEDGYLAAGQLMLAHTDVLIAIWDEQRASGRGGTEEIITEARMRGLITVLITLDGDLKLWTVPSTAADPVADGRWEPLAPEWDDATGTSSLTSRVRVQLTQPVRTAAEQGTQPADASAQGLQRFQHESLQPYSKAFGYSLLRWAFLPGQRFSLRVDNGLEQERQHAWAETRKAASLIGGDSFSEQLDARLRDRWIGADNLAVHYSHKFRSAYITNFSLAALAVMIGLGTVFFWESKVLKAGFVLVELALIGTILWNTSAGNKGKWRDRWLDYRSLAEALRPARLPLLIGSSPILSGDAVGSPPGQEWIAWYVRATLREHAPPTAVIDSETLQRALRVAINEEVDGQISYHRENALRLHRLDHRLEMAAEIAFWATVASGTLYLIAFGLYLQGHETLAAEYKPWATFLGGTLPVVGAAIFGIRATGDFRSAIQQSQRMVTELEPLRAALVEQLGSPQRSPVRRLLGRLGRALSDDLRIWSMIYSERQLVPGF